MALKILKIDTKDAVGAEGGGLDMRSFQEQRRAAVSTILCEECRQNAPWECDVRASWQGGKGNKGNA